MLNNAHVVAARAFAVFVADAGSADTITFAAGIDDATIRAYGSDGEPVTWRFVVGGSHVHVVGFRDGPDDISVAYPCAFPIDAAPDAIRTFFRENPWPGEIGDDPDFHDTY